MKTLSPAVFALLLTLAGCRQKMADQPRYDPLEPSRFFADGQSARPILPGVTPRGALPLDAELALGVSDPAALPEAEPSLEEADAYVVEFPIPISRGVLQRGRERFNIHCAPCHGSAGDGFGPVVEHGYPRAESFHADRLREAPPGYLFDVTTRGRRKMPPYARQVSVEDRWAIIAYIQALQFSQHADVEQLPAAIRTRLEELP